MLYVIGFILDKPDSNGNRHVTQYKLIDTLSESIWRLTPSQLKYIMSTNIIAVANAVMHNQNIEIQEWVDKLNVRISESAITTDLALLARDGDIYKVANRYGYVSTISLKELKELVSQEEVANCTIIDGKINWYTPYETLIDTEFKEAIATKYELFIAKSNMLGSGSMSFEYEIENHQVKLRQYTGSSKNIIIPSFITVIMAHAFKEAVIETISINEGVVVIGRRALASTDRSDELEAVTIPSTVVLVGNEAFANNTGLYNLNGSLDMTKIKLRNSKTIVIDPFA